MEVEPDIEAAVLARLDRTLLLLLQPEILESEGSVESVDVKLMPSKAEITVHPHITNKRVHDTYLQRGELKGLGQGGSDAMSNFTLAVEQIESKLHRWEKGATLKKDYRK